ncbi:nitrite reductase large subunit NirB [Acidipropionibacterium acidipropionici]|nr:nitrite reductase large subunit NirB [Acidipropionibacterium acidipropionici]
MIETGTDRTRVLVVGGGMVAHRFTERLRDEDTARRFDITVVGEEPVRPYDRVHLTDVLRGRAPGELELGRPLMWSDPCVHLRSGDPVSALNLEQRTAECLSGEVIGWDRLVLATGADGRRPPIEGVDLPGVFVYRSLDDVLGIARQAETLLAGRTGLAGSAEPGPPAVVLGGGLLGLEVAGALVEMGLDVTVVQSRGHVLSDQLDSGGGALLGRLVEEAGVHIHTGARADRIVAGADGAAGAVSCGGDLLEAQLIVMATGVRPRDELAVAQGIATASHGGILIDDCCRTNVPDVYAIGDVATVDGALPGLIAPGNQQADVLAGLLLGRDGSRLGALDDAARLKFSGVGAASFGDAFATTSGAVSVLYADPTARAYKRLVLSDDGRTLLGGMLVGDDGAYSMLRPLLGHELGADPATFLMPEAASAAPSVDLPDDALVCSCNSVTAGQIASAVRDGGCTTVAEISASTQACTTCGSCEPLVRRILDRQLASMGRTVCHAMCEHFSMSRRELFDAVQISGARTFSKILERHGTGGDGCDICKPAIASILAHLTSAHALDPDRAPLQDTNDRVLANMQKDGSYSVVPRIPGGEITPDGLVAIGTIAKEFGLYTKVTGAQRIDMFGARLDELPAIWERLIDAGFESGHAYGKALRNVKSCVGSSWCRYGVRDSVGMAVALELRYRGVRSPHKLKFGVSGCARECAEARSKDVGVIATEKGWNLYVGGNGGQSATLRSAGRGPRRRRAGHRDRQVRRLLHPHGRPAPAHRTLGRGSGRRHRGAAAGDLRGFAGYLRRSRRVHAGPCRELSGRVASGAGGSGAATPVRVLRQCSRQPRRAPSVCAGACSAPAHPGRGASRAAGVLEERGQGRRTMTTTATAQHAESAGAPTVARPGGWRPVCALADLIPGLGAAALVDGEQVALFRLRDDSVRAVQQADPHADGANVMSRGIVGAQGALTTLASPLHKELYDLATGTCLDPKGAEPISLRTWPVRVRAGRIEICTRMD